MADNNYRFNLAEKIINVDNRLPFGLRMPGFILNRALNHMETDTTIIDNTEAKAWYTNPWLWLGISTTTTILAAIWGLNNLTGENTEDSDLPSENSAP